MREHKIVVLGGMGSGKSTLVRAIAAGAVVDTDVPNSDRDGADKASTTVAMDYADIDLPNGDRLRRDRRDRQGALECEGMWPQHHGRTQRITSRSAGNLGARQPERGAAWAT